MANEREQPAPRARSSSRRWVLPASVGAVLLSVAAVWLAASVRRPTGVEVILTEPRPGAGCAVRYAEGRSLAGFNERREFDRLVHCGSTRRGSFTDITCLCATVDPKF